jgi:hypothetical protein
MRINHLRRREFIRLVGGTAVTWPLAGHAQQPPRMQRVGYVGIQPRDATLYLSFRRRMAELGYQEGRNFTFDYIQTPSIEGYEQGYRELAARKVDIFLAVGGEPALRAAQAAAGMLPIAFLAIDFDPAAKGYVANMMSLGAATLLACDANFPRASRLGRRRWLRRRRYNAESDSIQKIGPAWRPAQKGEVTCEKSSSRQDGLAEGPTFP